MSEITEFHKKAAAIALHKTFNDKHFSICGLDNVAKVLGVTLSGPDYDALRALHCVDYAAMGPEVAAQVRETCITLLREGGVTVTLEAHRPETPAPSAEVRRPRLAFWKGL